MAVRRYSINIRTLPLLRSNGKYILVSLIVGALWCLCLNDNVRYETFSKGFPMQE